MNVLEEYLVKIGADIDRNAFAGASQAINQLAGTLSRLNSLLKYGGILAAILKITSAIKDNIVAVAEADMEYQKLAKSMWVTKETAKALDMVTKTMGAKAEDIAWIPELRDQFFRLREEMNALATPADADGQLRWIREIGYDVQSLQLKLKMLREWIVYYLIKYLQPHIKELQNFIRWLGSQLGKNMPQIARTLARVLEGIVSLGVSALRLFKSVYGAISRFVNGLPEQTKKLVAAFALAGAAIMSGPFGMMMIAIGAALLLLEDFYYYLDGKKSSKSLAPLWRMLTQADGPVQKTLNAVKTALEDILNRITELFTKIFTPKVQESLKKTMLDIAGAVLAMAKGLANIISLLTGNSGKVNSFWDSFAKHVETAITRVGKLAGVIAKLFKAMGLAMSGEFNAAKNELIAAGFEAGSLIVDYAKDIGGFTGLAPKTMDEAKQYYETYVPEEIDGLQEGSKKAFAALVKDFYDTTGEKLWITAGKSGSGHAISSNGNGHSDGVKVDVAHERLEDPVFRAQYIKRLEDMGYAVYDEYDPANWTDNTTGGHLDIRLNEAKVKSMSTASYANSYAASFANNKPQSSVPTYGAVMNVGGIVINCGPGANPKEIADAVGDKLMDIQQTLKAYNCGGVMV